VKKIYVKALFLVAMSLPVFAAENIQSSESVTNVYPGKFYVPMSHPSLPERSGKWLTSESYEIARIDGFQDTYAAGEKIEFYVEGKSDRLDVTEDNGFAVLAMKFDVSKSTGYRQDVEYDKEKKAWLVSMTAPKEPRWEYKILVHLYCEAQESPCALTYGFGSQVTKVLYLQVH